MGDIMPNAYEEAIALAWAMIQWEQEGKSMAKEYIERDDAIYVIDCTNTFTFSRERTIEKLRAIPAADVVEVVRCEECE
ncbi:MAG: hypothetical protein IIX99_01575, partial [Oscillospiraceae bacterium]|nr:hypothetical protein [Oscillospiraceae bacterium]